MDADHIPESTSYLTKMLQGFVNPKVAWVSAPSINDSNIGESWISRGRCYMESTMHGTLQAGYHTNWASLCIGSHYAVRTKALKEVGGLGPELAEDHSTTLLLASGGHEGVHSIDAIAHGEGPITFKDCMFQEFQWARSLVMIAVETTPKCIRKLTPRLIFQFCFAQSWYFLFTLTMVLGYSLSPIALVTNCPFTNMGYWTYAYHALAPTIACWIIVKWLGKQNLLRPHYSKVLSWESILFQMARWPYLTIALFDAFRVVICKKYIVWKVTPKENEDTGVSIRFLAPYLTIVTLCVSAILFDFFVHKGINQIGYTCLTSLTIFWYSFLTWFVPHMHRKEQRARIASEATVSEKIESYELKPINFSELQLTN
jgi:hypothetical protein